MGDAVETRDVRIEFGLPVVGLNLGCKRVPCQTQALHKATTGRKPVDVWKRHNVRRISSRRPVELPQVLSFFDAFEGALQPPDENTKFFADSGGGGALPVCPRQHWSVAKLLRHLGKPSHQALCGRKPHVLDGTADPQGH